MDANRTTYQGYSYVYVVNIVCKGRPLQTQINTHVVMTCACFPLHFIEVLHSVYATNFSLTILVFFHACIQFHILMFHILITLTRNLVYLWCILITYYMQPLSLMLHNSYFTCNYFHKYYILHTLHATTFTYVSYFILYMQLLSLMLHTLYATTFTYVSYFILYMQLLSHMLHTLHATTFTYVSYFILYM